MNPVFDTIRAAAALMVLIGHALSIYKGWPTWPQQLGVVIFFLLSGYLISQTLHNRLRNPGSTFTDYAIDRWSRIYSGFLPALLFVAALDYVMISKYAMHPETVQRFSVGSFVANLFMLQAPAITLPFASAGPFWTVAIEFWIYIFVGLVAFAARDGIRPLWVIAIFFAGYIPVQSYADNNMVLIPWLLGAAAERIAANGWIDKLPSKLLAAASAGLTVIAVQSAEKMYSWSSFLLTGLIFLFATSALRRVEWQSSSRSGRFVIWCAGWSYSLYLLHHTILMDYAVAHGGGWQSVAAAIAISVIVSIVFAMLTETHHKRIAAYLKARIGIMLAFVARRFASPGSAP